MNLSIDKRKLWRYVNKKIHNSVHHYHVLSIITILFEEIINELLAGNDIKIHNFGKLTLKKLKPRKYFNVLCQKVMESEGNKILRFTLSPSIKKIIIKNLDIDKTLRDN